MSLSDPRSSFIETRSLTEILQLNPNWNEIHATGNTTTGNVTVQFPPDITFSNFTIGVMTGGQQHSNGHLGLAQSSVFLQRLVDANLTATKGFSFKYDNINPLSHRINLILCYSAGSQFTNRSGHIVFGGFDRSSVATHFSDFNINSSRLARFCPLQVQIRNLDIAYANDVIPLIGPGNSMTACIEPCEFTFLFNVSLLLSGRLQVSEGSDPITVAGYPESSSTATLIPLRPSTELRVRIVFRLVPTT